MKSNKRSILAMLLALSMSVTMVASCGGDDEPEDTISKIDVNEGDDPSRTLDLPNLNFNDDEFTVLHYEGYAEGNNDETASPLSRAKYEQYAATADRLGIEFQFVSAPKVGDVPGMVTQSINAGGDDYQLVYGCAHQVVGMVYEGFFLPVEELPHVSLDKEWWNEKYMSSVSINANRPYVLFGDISYNMIERSAVCIFNSRILEEVHHMDSEELFDIVLDGEWTLDKFAELASDVYTDNGNNQNDIEDLHGVTCMGSREFEFMLYSSGLTFSNRDADGYPVINMYNEKTITLVDKLLPVFKSADTFATSGTQHASNDYVDIAFAGGHALFMPSRLFQLGFASVRDMKDDYGVLPMPKFDESIDNYYSVTGNAVAWCLVPNTVQDPEMVSAAVESLAYEGYHRTTPVYYEENLKLKYSRGDDVDTQSEILDIVKNNARTDFIYLAPLGNLSKMFSACYNANSNNIASLYAKVETSALQSLQNLIEKTES